MYFGMNLFNISYWKTSDLYRFSIVFPDSKDPAMLFSGGYHPYEPCLGRICQLQLRRPLQKGTQQWVRPRRRNQQLRKVVWYLGLVYNMFIQPNHPNPDAQMGYLNPRRKPRSCSVSVICQLRCLNLKPWMRQKWEKHWFALWKIWPLEQKKWHGDTWRDVDMDWCWIGVDGCWWLVRSFFFGWGCSVDALKMCQWDSMKLSLNVVKLWWL